MTKVSLPPTNAFCPQALFLYGTDKPDGCPNFGLFCWFSYYWDTELKVMACIGGDKQTKDQIHRTGVFSACMVTERLLPIADYLGNTDGYRADKMEIPVQIERGAVLPVPVLADSPWCFELEVINRFEMDGGEIYHCVIRNVLADERLSDEKLDLDERMRLASPVVTAGIQRYFSLNSHSIGAWGQWKHLREEGTH